MSVIAEQGKDYPTVAEELLRKTLEELQRLCTDHLNNRISGRELEIALKAIHNCTSGLLTDDMFEAVTAAVTHAEQEKQHDWSGHFKVFSKGSQIALVAYVPEERSYTVVMLPNDSRKFTMPTHELHPYKRAFKSAEAVVRKLIQSGYKEVK